MGTLYSMTYITEQIITLIIIILTVAKREHHNKYYVRYRSRQSVVFVFVQMLTDIMNIT
jgi:hypothetical protein